MHCATSVLDKKRGTSFQETLPIAIKSQRRHPNKDKCHPISNDRDLHAGSLSTKPVFTPSSPFFQLPPSLYASSHFDATMDLFEEDFAFELPLYTPSQISLESKYTHGLARAPRQRKRYAPYLVPHRSMHKMNLYYVDAAYIEDAREVYRPAAPEPALDAILHPPPNGIRGIAVGGFRALNQILGFVNNQVRNLRRTVLPHD